MPITMNTRFQMVKAKDAAIQIVKALLHFDALTGGTFTDEFGHVIQNIGVTLDTTIKKFGTGSAYSSGGALIYPLATDDYLLDGWTIEAQIYPTGTLLQWFVQEGSGASPASITPSGDLDIRSNSGPIGILSMGTYALNTWTHLAVVRNGNVITTYKDGIQQDTITLSLPNDELVQSVPGNRMIIVGNYEGNIDEFRFTNGAAVYTSNFTPPVAPFSPP
jgi:hypothetical protein